MNYILSSDSAQVLHDNSATHAAQLCIAVQTALESASPADAFDKAVHQRNHVSHTLLHVHITSKPAFIPPAVWDGEALWFLFDDLSSVFFLKKGDGVGGSVMAFFDDYNGLFQFMEDLRPHSPDLHAKLSQWDLERSPQSH